MPEEGETNVKASRKEAAVERDVGEQGCSSLQQELLCDSPGFTLGANVQLQECKHSSSTL